jgi:spermidine synthase
LTTMPRPGPSSLFLVLTVLVGITGLAQVVVQTRRSAGGTAHGEVIHETRSEFSRIRVREKDRVRRLLFVDEAGDEFCQSAIDLDDPATLQHGYAKGMFASLLFREPQDRVLIVGLGGGGMVRFLNERFPETLVEAVEIDPVVVGIAAEYFGVRDGPRTKLHTADAFTFFDAPRGEYDAIYLDAFLRAPESTGLGETTKRLKTESFLATLRAHLKEGGVIAFNLIVTDPRTDGDLEAIRAVFPGMVRFAVPGTGNLVVIAPREGESPSMEELIQRSGRLDGIYHDSGFSFGDLARNRIN